MGQSEEELRGKMAKVDVLEQELLKEAGLPTSLDGLRGGEISFYYLNGHNDAKLRTRVQSIGIASGRGGEYLLLVPDSCVINSSQVLFFTKFPENSKWVVKVVPSQRGMVDEYLGYVRYEETSALAPIKKWLIQFRYRVRTTFCKPKEVSAPTNTTT